MFETQEGALVVLATGSGPKGTELLWGLEVHGYFVLGVQGPNFGCFG